MYEHMWCPGTCVDLRSTLAVVPQRVCGLVFDSWPRVHLSRFGLLACVPWGSSCLHLSKLGLQTCATMSVSRLAFPTEPSPQPCSFNNPEWLTHLKQIIFSHKPVPHPPEGKYNIPNVCTLFIISMYRDLSSSLKSSGIPLLFWENSNISLAGLAAVKLLFCTPLLTELALNVKDRD